MRRQRSTKIIATLGPNSSDPHTIEGLFLAGADLFRLNFSHGDVRQHQENLERVRFVSRKYQTPIGVIQDLPGPKIRIGRFKDHTVNLTPGQQFILDRQEALGDQSRVCLPHPEVFQALTKGTDILLNDGNVKLRVEEAGADYCRTTVLYGVALSDHKGVNVPGVMLPINALTERDREYLKFGLDIGVDFIALSFVQSAEDVALARRLIDGRAQIIAKIEKPFAVRNLSQILELSDALMVARGDLGVEMNMEEVPLVQKQIVQACQLADKPVIVATQMLESMIYHPTPTRAEVSDVATAVYDRVDAVMLSAESASGAYPIEAVNMMNRIVERTEKAQVRPQKTYVQENDDHLNTLKAITHAASGLAQSMDVKAIVTVTDSGKIALYMASQRPNAPILALSTKSQTVHALTLAWGVQPRQFTAPFSMAQSLPKMNRNIEEAIIHYKLATAGEKILVTLNASPRTVKELNGDETDTACGLYVLTLSSSAA